MVRDDKCERMLGRRGVGDIRCVGGGNEVDDVGGGGGGVEVEEGVGGVEVVVKRL